MMNGHRTIDLRLKRHHDELREYWQARALLHLHATRQYDMLAVLVSVLAHCAGIDAFRTLMLTCFPGFVNIRPPFYSSAAKIMKGGEVAADLMQADRTVQKNAMVFKDKAAMEGAFRRLADELSLNDQDRTAMFAWLQRWVVADFRRDPNRTEAA